jgi:hypothetical protein
MFTQSSQCSTPNAQPTSHDGTRRPRIKPRRNTHFSVAARWSKSCSSVSTPSCQNDLCKGLTRTRNLTCFSPRRNRSAYEFKLKQWGSKAFPQYQNECACCRFKFKRSNWFGIDFCLGLLQIPLQEVNYSFLPFSFSISYSVGYSTTNGTQEPETNLVLFKLCELQDATTMLGQCEKFHSQNSNRYMGNNIERF